MIKTVINNVPTEVDKIYTKQVGSNIQQIKKIYSIINNVPNKIYSALPPEYQEVNYLATDGEAYIITNFIPNITNIYDFKAELRFKDGADQVVFGTREDTGNTRFFPLAVASSGNVSKANIGYTTYQYGNSINVLNTVEKFYTHFEQGTQTWGIEGDEPRTLTMSFESGFTFTKPMHLFRANHTSPTQVKVGGAIYSLSVWENGKLIINYVPCYRKSDNEAGMYDIVNDVFYTNAGAGSFTVGDDIN